MKIKEKQDKEIKLTIMKVIRKLLLIVQKKRQTMKEKNKQIKIIQVEYLEKALEVEDSKDCLNSH